MSHEKRRNKNSRLTYATTLIMSNIKTKVIVKFYQYQILNDNLLKTING
jgi:hypothetical protein